MGKNVDANYIAEKPEDDFKVIIDKSVKKVRPFTSCAIVKGLKFDDDVINEVIEIQLSSGLADIEAIQLSRLVVAYEPIWAIGTGKVPSKTELEKRLSLV